MMAVTHLEGQVCRLQGEQKFTRTVQMDEFGFHPESLSHVISVSPSNLLEKSFSMYFMPISSHHVRSFVSLPRVCRRAPSNALGIRTASHLATAIAAVAEKCWNKSAWRFVYHLMIACMPTSLHGITVSSRIFGMHTCDFFGESFQPAHSLPSPLQLTTCHVSFQGPSQGTAGSRGAIHLVAEPS